MSRDREGAVSSLRLQSNTLQNHTELHAVVRRHIKLVNRHPECSVGIRRQPVGWHRLLKMLEARRGVADCIQRLAIYQKPDLQRTRDLEAIVPNRKILA